MQDDRMIPDGGYCYTVQPVAPGAVLSKDIDRFGKDLREYPFHPGFKQVLCPYWKRTDHGMVRCDFLGIEGLDGAEPGAKAKAIAHYGTVAAFESANKSPEFLPDEIKVCGIRDDEDGDEVAKLT